jgi:hypothetical protein
MIGDHVRGSLDFHKQVTNEYAVDPNGPIRRSAKFNGIHDARTFVVSASDLTSQKTRSLRRQNVMRSTFMQSNIRASRRAERTSSRSASSARIDCAIQDVAHLRPQALIRFIDIARFSLLPAATLGWN